MTATLADLRPFTAVADCPACGDVDIHWLDTPRRPTQTEIDEYETSVENWKCEPSTIKRAWGGEVVAVVGRYPPPVPPVDESAAEVVRVCRACGTRWGCR